MTPFVKGWMPVAFVGLVALAAGGVAIGRARVLAAAQPTIEQGCALLDAKDAAGLAALVDWPALRAQLSADWTARYAQAPAIAIAGIEAQQRPLEDIQPIVEQAVATWATPERLAFLLEQRRRLSTVSSCSFIIRQRATGIDEIEFTARDIGSAVTLAGPVDIHGRRDATGAWKISGIVLPAAALPLGLHGPLDPSQR